MTVLTEMQPRIGGGAGGADDDELVYSMAGDMLDKLPKGIHYIEPDETKSIQVFRAQEVVRFNALLHAMKQSLIDIQKGIKGLVVMSSELEKIFKAFLMKEVPAYWSKKSYLSLKPLASWMQDLIARIEFMQGWVQEDPKSYWLSAFFFPQGKTSFRTAL